MTGDAIALGYLLRKFVQSVLHGLAGYLYVIRALVRIFGSLRG